MVESWRLQLERTGEPWYMLAHAEDSQPRVAEGGRVMRHGIVSVNLVVHYGSEYGPWVKVGTWDYSISGSVPGSEARAEMDQDNVTDRLVLTATAAAVPEGAAMGGPVEVERRLRATRAALAPWEATELRIDGIAHAALLSRVGDHQLVYTTAIGRCVFVQSHDCAVPTAIVSCTDRELLDRLTRRRSSGDPRY